MKKKSDANYGDPVTRDISMNNDGAAMARLVIEVREYIVRENV